MTKALLIARLVLPLILLSAVPCRGQGLIPGESEPAESEPVLTTEAARPNLTSEEVRLLKEWAGRISADPTVTASARGSSAKQDDNREGTNGKTAEKKQPDLDPNLVAAGQGAFNSSCTTCHDAERSLNKRKSLTGWLATTRRMAAKDGADVPASEFQAIATYLASVAGTGANGGADGGGETGGGASSDFNLFATVSLIHRSGAQGDMENPGFFPEVWLGAEWNPSGVLSGRVHACVTCHTENPAVSSRIELAEGFFKLDVDKLLTCCDDACIQAAASAGRFIVPFGAFASVSHPGAFRTATRPMMYNMGQKIYRTDIGAPLLPMPYSDEGVLLSANADVIGNITATVDAYAVNGLQGSTAMDLAGFWAARDYVDNNSEPAVGGRVTVGNKMLKLGGSIMSGRYNDNGPLADITGLLDYKIAGFDATFRWEDEVRISYEYARRLNDVFDFNRNDDLPEDIRGSLIEGEFKLWDCPRISAVVRYDDQRRISDLPLQGSQIVDPRFTVSRITWGFNFDLGGSTLMVNHERWKLPAPLQDEDVLAIRWVAAF